MLSNLYSNLHGGIAVFSQHESIAVQLVNDLLSSEKSLQEASEHFSQVMVPYPGGDQATINLTPFAAQAQKADANPYFSQVKNIQDLLTAYTLAKKSKPFETDLADACEFVSDYAAEFLQEIFNLAGQTVDDDDACRIAALVSKLDIYTAVKAVESLLNSHADLALLRISEVQGWTLHFDHLAIRCGCSERGDAERVVDNLRTHHGYVPCQIDSENYYKFDDGWDAYVLYKILENGQQLRLFIDQSSVANTAQIIQHWNYVYGYTAHHLALRATRLINGERKEVPLSEMIGVVEQNNIKAMTATGQYTVGLLEQVFTKPELNKDIPQKIRQHLGQYDASLQTSIENGKLLELVSRREISESLKPAYFALYDIEYDCHNPLHSAPVYPYFLPVQAAHVIRTSAQVG